MIAATDPTDGHAIDLEGVSAYTTPQIWPKRGLDITVSVVAAPLALLASVLIGICVFISSPGNPNHVRYPERATLDTEYFEHWTFWTDIVILLKTILSVIARHGTH